MIDKINTNTAFWGCLILFYLTVLHKEWIVAIPMGIMAIYSAYHVFKK